MIITVMSYFIDPFGKIAVWTPAVHDGSTMGFPCLIHGYSTYRLEELGIEQLTLEYCSTH